MYVFSIFALLIFAHSEKSEKELAVEKGCKTRTMPDGTIIKYGLACTGPVVIRPE